MAKYRKTLILRLSSLGDVILATSSLPAVSQTSEFVHFVTDQAYVPLLNGHPHIDKVWGFDRKSGLKGWLSLAKQLQYEDFDLVLDLHRSLRTRIFRLFFWFSAIFRMLPLPEWKTLSKERWRLIGYFAFKSLWPQTFRPRAITLKSSRLADGDGSGKPDLSFLMRSVELPRNFPPAEPARSLIAVMPSSMWKSKEWPVERYFSLLKTLPFVPLVLGTQNDEASLALLKLLSESRVRHIDGVGKWSFAELARVISECRFYLGNDTGLAHLAESVGVPAYVVYGPTQPDIGFGVWRPESKALGAKLKCRPCSKDGKFCQRFWDRHACLKKLDAAEVSRQIQERQG